MAAERNSPANWDALDRERRVLRRSFTTLATTIVAYDVNTFNESAEFIKVNIDEVDRLLNLLTTNVTESCSVATDSSQPDQLGQILSETTDLAMKAKENLLKLSKALPLAGATGGNEAPPNQSIADIIRFMEKMQIDRDMQQRTDQAQLLQTLIAQLTQTKAPGNPPVGAKRMKLPEIKLPRFEGDFESWLEFKDTFESMVHNNEGLNSIDKFHHLRHALSGEAAELTKTIAISDANYEQAWAQLTKRYHNTNWLVERYMAVILEPTRMAKDSVADLRKIVTSLNNRIGVLNQLGVATNTWDQLFIGILLKSVDIETVKEWTKVCPIETLPTFKEFEEFLQKRIKILEWAVSTSKPSQQHQHKQQHQQQMPSSSRQIQPQTQSPKRASSYVAKAHVCSFCKESHRIYGCGKFGELPIVQRREQALSLKLCFNCLGVGHTIKNCKSKVVCSHCDKHHHKLLCFNPSNEKPADSKTTSHPSNIVPVPGSTHQSTHRNHTKVLLSTAIVNVRNHLGNSTLVRALLDSGSEMNFINERVCTFLNLKKSKQLIEIGGIGQSVVNSRFIAAAEISSRDNEYRQQADFLVLPRITIDLPSKFIDTSEWDIPKGISLADPDFNSPSKVEMIIGAHIFFDSLRQERAIISPSLPILQNTAFGYVVAGNIVDSSNSIPTSPAVSNLTSCFHLVRNPSESIDQLVQKFWEMEDFPNQDVLSPEEIECEKSFMRTISQDSSGRLTVDLPLKDSPAKLQGSRIAAHSRFLWLERRFARNEQLKKQCSDFIKEYIDMGHMTQISETEIDPGQSYFMPYHPIFRPDSSTTKTRIVFDASCSSSSAASLNDILMVGPSIQSDLPSIIMRFRLRKYAITADSEKMFRQVNVSANHRGLQLILWRDDPSQDIQAYRLNTLVYGTASASFQSTRALKYIADQYAEQHPIAAATILKDFFVDDWIGGSDSIDAAVELRKSVSQILSSGCFNLRKWASNSEEVLIDVPEIEREKSLALQFDRSDVVKTLGLYWEPHLDRLSYNFKLVSHDKPTTKRQILSEVTRLFDPLGLIGPAIAYGKIIIQQIWKENIGWDNQVPDHIAVQWIEFRKLIDHLNKIRIPRFILASSLADLRAIEIHGFCDASDKAYGACIYIRSIRNDGKIVMHLLTSKSKVAPMSGNTTPRSELCGALLLANLFENVKKALESFVITQSRFWTDSMIVLHWILDPNPSKFSKYIRNRVNAIHAVTQRSQWNHIAGSENPADHISRGLLPNQLDEHNHLWWHGPGWLNQEFNIVDEVELQPVNSDLLEINGSHTAANIAQQLSHFECEILNRFSSYEILLRVVAIILRWRKPSNRLSGKIITIAELNAARDRIISIVQHQHFAKDIASIEKMQFVDKASKIIKFTPFLDDIKILRVGGRLQKSNLPYNQKHPTLLPANSNLTKLIIDYYHRIALHAGPQLLLSTVRQSYWPINGRNLARKCVKTCIKCYRFNPTVSQQIMGNLPSQRVQPSSPFTVTGVDYCGPFTIASDTRKGAKPKVFLAIFICFAIKASHIEVVKDLTTTACIAALHRFVSRRGLPTQIHSDNGSSFVGARNELIELQNLLQSQHHQDDIRQAAADLGIEWKFLPPRASHQAGIWESCVKQLKSHLYRELQTFKPTLDEMLTLTARIEACLNSRPLWPQHDDPNDPLALTPGHFLIGRPLTAIPEPDLADIKLNRLSRWQRTQHIVQSFWKSWSSQYLHNLQARLKWRTICQNVAVGMIVLMVAENAAPLHWPLGKITAVHRGEDHKVRSVIVRVNKKEYKRPITKICVLPIDDNVTSVRDNLNRVSS